MTPPGQKGVPLPEFETILRSVDREQPMNGEKAIASASIDEARLWTHVYRDLVAMEKKVLAAVTKQLPDLSAQAREEAESTNVPLITGQLQRFEHRLTLWEARRAELEGQRR
jgi:hypothetical protein